MTPASYAQLGYARFDGAIDPAVAAEAADWIARKLVHPDLPSTCDPHRRGDPKPIKLRRLWDSDPDFWRRFLCASGVLALPRTLLGETFLLIRSAAFIKYPGSAAFVGWHCDADLWGHRCDAGLTAWIPLTPAPLESGCLQFIPGSHRAVHGQLYWDLRHPFHKVMDVTGAPPPVPVAAAVGDCIVMDRRTVHASEPNRSEHDRIGLVLAFARCAHADLNESALAIGPGERFEQVAAP